MPDVVINHETPVVISTALQTFPGGTRLDIAGRFAFIPIPDNDGITVMDISNPNLMEAVNNVPMPGTKPIDIRVSGKYAYVSTLNKLKILDISNIDATQVISETVSIGTDLRDIFIIGKYALVLVQGPTPKLSVIDIEDPLNPIEVNTLTLNNTPERGHYNLGYIYTCDQEGGAHVINVSDPLNPVLTAHLDPLDNHPALTGTGKDIYVSGRYGYALYDSPAKIVLLDLFEPSFPATLTPFTVASAKTIEVHADSAYLSSGEVVDVSDPNNLVSLVTGPSSDMITLAGKNGYGLDGGNLKSYGYSGIQSPTGNIGSLKTSKLTVFDDIDACNNVKVHNKVNVGIGGIHCDGNAHSREVDTRKIVIKNLGTGSDPTITANSTTKELILGGKLNMGLDKVVNVSEIILGGDEDAIVAFPHIRPDGFGAIVDGHVTATSHFHLPNNQDLHWDNFAKTLVKFLKLNTNDVLESNAKNFILAPVVAETPRFIMLRDTILGQNSVIGNFRARTLSSTGVEKNFAEIKFFNFKSLNGQEESDIRFSLRSAGSLIDIASFNKNGANEILFLRKLDMSNNLIENILNPVSEQDAATKGYVDDKRHIFENDTFREWSKAGAGTAGIKINAGDDLETNAQEFIISRTGQTLRFRMLRDEILADGTTISQFRASSQDSLGNIQNYAQYKFIMEKSLNGSEEGSGTIEFQHNSTLEDFMKFNIGQSNKVQIPKTLDMEGNIIENAILENTSDNYIYVKTPDDFGPLLTLSNITAFSDIGGGEIQCASLAHGLVTGNVVQFSGTPYDTGTHEIIRVDANNFKFTETFTATGTGTWTAKKRQVFRSQGRMFYYILDEIALDAPLLLTPPNAEFAEYVFHTDVIGFNRLTVDYDTSLGACFQGKDVFSFTRSGVHTALSAALQTANIRTCDITFEGTSFSFFLDDAVTDFGGGVLLTDANFVTYKNNSFYSVVGAGHKFVNCEALDVNNISLTPVAGITFPVFEIDETVRTTQATFAIMKIPTLASGKNAFKIDSALDSASRVQIINCRIPDVANLFDSTGLDETDIKVNASSNAGHKPSFSVADAQHIGSTTTTVTSIDEVVVLGGTNWTEGSASEGFSVSTSGVITKNDLETRTYKIQAVGTVSKVGGGSDIIEVGFKVNGTDDIDSFRPVENSGPAQSNPSIIKTMSTTDTIQLIGRNRTSTKDIVLDNSNIFIVTV